MNLNNLTQYINNLGLTVLNNDLSLLKQCLNDAINEVKFNTNLSSISSDLENCVIKLATSKYLLLKKTFNPQSFSNLDLSRAVKQVSVGDVSTTFDDDSSNESKLDYIINQLQHIDYSAFRKIKWW